MDDFPIGDLSREWDPHMQLPNAKPLVDPNTQQAFEEEWKSGHGTIHSPQIWWSPSGDVARLQAAAILRQKHRDFYLEHTECFVAQEAIKLRKGITHIWIRAQSVGTRHRGRYELDYRGS
ncbi:hypothetical protein PG987_013932 [Apiospora arundinis]